MDYNLTNKYVSKTKVTPYERSAISKTKVLQKEG